MNRYLLLLLAALLGTASCTKKNEGHSTMVATPAVGNWLLSVDRQTTDNVDTMVLQINGTDTTAMHTVVGHTYTEPTGTIATAITWSNAGYRVSNLLNNTPASPDTSTVVLFWNMHDSLDNSDVYVNERIACCNDLGSATLRYYPNDSIVIHFFYQYIAHGQPLEEVSVTAKGKRR